MSITPKMIRAARIEAGLTQKQAGQLVHVTLRAWQNWESPEGSINYRPMPLMAWELFQIKIS